MAAAAGHPTDWAAAELQGPCCWLAVAAPVPLLVAGMQLVADKEQGQLAAEVVESWHSASGGPCLVNQHCTQKDSHPLQVAETAESVEAAASSLVGAIS